MTMREGAFPSKGPGRRGVCVVLFLSVLLPVQLGRAEVLSSVTVRLELSRAAKPERFLPLLPVVVTIRLSNPGQDVVSVRPLSPELAFLGKLPRHYAVGTPSVAKEALAATTYQFVIGRDGEHVGRAVLSDHVPIMYTADDQAVAADKVPARPLRPGESWEIDYSLGYGMLVDQATTTPTILFDRPGRYTLRLEMPYAVDGGLTSNEISVSVASPGADADLRALAILSDSSCPAIFLAPPAGATGNPFLAETRPPMARAAIDVAARILEECAGSTYASYARLLLGNAHSLVPLRALKDEPSRERQIQERVQGLRMLRTCADDPILPRRFREQALERLAGAENLIRTMQYSAPDAEAVLKKIFGGKTVDVGGLPAQIVLQAAYDVAQGKAAPGYENLLRAKLTPEQFDALRAAVTSDPDIAQAGGVSEIQRELRDYAGWARAELRNLPWRDASGDPKWRFGIRSDYLD